MVDFHALRHSFITALARSGVHPKVAQTLARHSTITLTLDRYSHVETDELSIAVAGLPDLSGDPTEAASMTGTYGRTADERLARCLAFLDAPESISLPSSASETAVDRTASSEESTPENAGCLAISGALEELRPAGIEPATCGLEVRCSIQLSYGRS